MCLKNSLIYLFCLFPFLLIGQNLTCCTSDKDVEEHLTGYWKIKDSKSKTVYHYWFNNGQGHVEDLVSTNKKGEFEVVERNHSFVYIDKKETSYILNYIYKYGNWNSKLTYLDTEKMVLITNGKTTEYYRIPN